MIDVNRRQRTGDFYEGKQTQQLGKKKTGRQLNSPSVKGSIIII